MFDIKNLETKIAVYERAIHDALKESIGQIVKERGYDRVVFTGVRQIPVKAYKGSDYEQDSDLERIVVLFSGQFGTYPTGEWSNGAWTEY